MGDLQLWYAALGGMRSNPLVLQLRAAERERRARRRWYAQPWLWGAGLGLVCGVAYSYVSLELGMLSLPLLLAAWAARAVIVAAVCWYGAGLVHAASQALHFLAAPVPRTAQRGSDATVPPAANAAREQVCGLLWVLLPPLVWRAALGAVLAWACLLLVHSTGRLTGLQSVSGLLALSLAQPALSLRSGLLTVAVLCATSVPALAALLLSLVILGRGLSPGWRRFTAAGVLASQWANSSSVRCWRRGSSMIRA